MIVAEVHTIMLTITDFQSQARLFGMFPILLALGGWYFVRGDRLKHALRNRITDGTQATH
ncbi:hypothetical protein BX591_104208 [Paraburkholderia bryophila]|uniref:Uncharacterized protein n=2 Tax=Paraburkholderia bryophila TaxID=420952 RepID=A0A329CNR0_9BURK|nr:hypothetical protein BX591_104208 [Paraburkholderia bryophila]